MTFPQSDTIRRTLMQKFPRDLYQTKFLSTGLRVHTWERESRWMEACLAKTQYSKILGMEGGVSIIDISSFMKVLDNVTPNRWSLESLTGGKAPINTKTPSSNPIGSYHCVGSKAFQWTLSSIWLDQWNQIVEMGFLHDPPGICQSST